MGKPNLRLAGAVLLLAALAGCAAVAPLPEIHRQPLPMPGEIAERFDYPRTPVVADATLRDDEDAFRIYDVRMESGLDDGDGDTPITLEYYEQKADGPSPVILVLPILNGQKHVIRPFATHFVDNGYSAVIVDSLQRKTLLEDMIRPEEAIRETIRRHRRVLDWIETRPELDATRIAVFGASLGGFNALFLAAADERVRAVAPALVGGDLPYVLTYSTERRIREAAERTREALQADDAELEAYLAERIVTDPLDLAPYIDADRVLMVLARYDDAVPYRKQMQLLDALGWPESIKLPTGHISAAAYLFYLRSRVLEFFDRKLAHADGGSVSEILPRLR
ncbi:MAG: dienelactone hydrolase family protein [Gammaproteobacteria bacterium]|nr:dienelactone hydrolase family protein [Gammaproteobacteria bacterium]MDH5311385.1 dienelactone hydrolase family protein [Gammaproteobacteria bacterium]